MSDYTPGPWKACVPRFGYQIVRQDPPDWDGRGYQAICSVPQSNKGTHYGEMFKANARLIAASPDLLDACKAAREVLDRLITAPAGDSWRALSMLDNAIAKAELDPDEASYADLRASGGIVGAP